MSILKKPYTISVWEDVWDNGAFVERRLGIIGTHDMIAQCRAMKPNLVRNVNGTKKFSFQMYSQYTDIMTGELVQNPYVDWLISERKIKLEYDGKWYDFVIKDISENSATHLYTYSLEDALVQELSKNGFGMTFDPELMNNTGSAKELAEYALEDTNWQVESEVFVERVDEALVYINIPGTFSGKIYQLKDNKSDFLQNGLTPEESNIPKGRTVLAFYSSCKNKPHRFQFICLDSYDKDQVHINRNRQIVNESCQYYIEFEPTTTVWKDESGFSLPSGLSLVKKTYSDDKINPSDSTISTWYRGGRYGFAQKAKYVPLLERYCQVFEKGDKQYYGYTENKYDNPIFKTNLVSNTTFESTSGWTGSKINKEKTSASIEAVFGLFDGNKFINSIDVLRGKELYEGGYQKFIEEAKPYLKLVFGDEDGSAVINSGIRDNKALIGNMASGEKYAFRAEYIKDDNSTSGLKFAIGEYEYDPVINTYTVIAKPNIIFDKLNDVTGLDGKTYQCYEVKDQYATEKEFQNNNVRIVITAKAGTYYLENMEFFSASFKGEKLVTLNNQISNGEDNSGIITKTYKYFDPDKLKNLTSAKELEYELTTDVLNYTTYKPVYNDNGEKIRSISAKESNYFNILQSIAENFECWLDVDVSRDATGAIIGKKIKFKNYAGDTNYAAIRYGVNLKNIQRTHSSKNIVTKLMVKQNSNEFGKNGFCTIVRAGANPTGENYIYDFQYYQNMGLMDTAAYIGYIYGNSEEVGYYDNLRATNDELIEKNEILSNAAAELRELNAQLAVQSARKEAATSGIEEVNADFKTLTSQNILAYESSADESDEVKNYFAKYDEYNRTLIDATNQEASLNTLVDEKKACYISLANEIESLKERKAALNKEFFKVFAPFIQEGTWISEEHYDDEKYFNDAQSVMYNSCYPQVAYTINTMEISQLPGYELFKFELGDKTYVEDGEFFGYDENGNPNREEIIISEKSEMLDDPSQNTNKVQTFKNQFQDLFQKITATTQQVQYNSGAYERGAAEANEIAENSVEFLNRTLAEMATNLSNPDLTSESYNKTSQLRIVDGKLLIGKRNADDMTWTTGISSEGISADLITAGRINTGQIQIYSGNDPAFRWDAKGLSAYYYTEGQQNSASKFVRFDKYGIYGVDDGEGWYAQNASDVSKKATFALTWEGLKVAGEDGTLHIGNNAKINSADKTLFKVTNKENEVTMQITSDGSIELLKGISWSQGTSPTQIVYASPMIDGSMPSKPTDGKDYGDFPSQSIGVPGEWHKVQNSKVDIYGSYTYDGGKTWGAVTQIVGIDGEKGETGEKGEKGEQGIRGPQGPKGDKGDSGTGVNVKPSADECLEIGDAYIDTDGNLMILTSLDPREFTNGGQIKGPQGEASYFHVAYSNSADGAEDFSTSDYVDKTYIGQYVDNIEQDSEVYSDYSWTKWKGEPGKDGKDGKDGEKGDQGDSISVAYAYYLHNDSTPPNSKPPQDGWNDEWVKDIPSYKPEENKRYIFTSQCLVTNADTSSPIFGEWSDPILSWYLAQDGTNGSDATVTMENTMNALTNNGEDPIIEEVDGKLYINADYIQTGIFKVKKEKDSIFEANVKDGTVYLAGWTVTPTQLTNGTIGTSDSFGIYPDGISNDSINDNFQGKVYLDTKNGDSWVLTAGKSLGVTKNGMLFANNVQLEGHISANSGNFGNLSIISDSENAINDGAIQYAHHSRENQDITDKYVILNGDGLTVSNDTYNDLINISSYVAIKEKSIQVRSNNSNTLIEPNRIKLTPSGGSEVSISGSYADRLHDIIFTIKDNGQDKTVKVSDLAFKGPYDIKMGSTVIGKVAQMGPIVYGYIDSTTFTTYTTGAVLVIGGTISSPKKDFNAVIAYSSGNKVFRLNISTKGVFTMTGDWNSTGDLDGSNKIPHGYFCYSVGTHTLHD